MSDKKIEELLQKLPGTFEENLPFLEFDEGMRETVRIKSRTEQRPRQAPGRKHIMLQAAVFALFFLLGTGSHFLGNDAAVRRQLPVFTQVESKLVDLDGEGTPEMVSTWQVKEGNARGNLVALIWARDGEGRWQLVSSQPVQGGKFLPLEVLGDQEHRGSFVVVSTADAQRTHYQVFGYNGREVLPYLRRSSPLNEQKGQLLEEIRSLLPASFEK